MSMRDDLDRETVRISADVSAGSPMLFGVRYLLTMAFERYYGRYGYSLWCKTIETADVPVVKMFDACLMGSFSKVRCCYLAKCRSSNVYMDLAREGHSENK